MFLFMYIKNFLLFELLIRNNESLFELKDKKIIEYSKAKTDYLKLKSNQRKLIEYYKANTYLITFESIDNITFEIIENSINLSILSNKLKDIKNNSIIPLKEIERNYLQSYKTYMKANKKERKQRKKAKKENTINFKFIFNTIKNNKNNYLNSTIKSFIENIDNYHIVKLNNESIDILNLKFVYFKNNYNLIYNGTNKVLLTNRNIEIENKKYRIFIYSILLNDNIESFLIFNKNYDFKFKVTIANLLKLNYFEFLKFKDISITNNEKKLLNEIENKKYYFIDNNERKESLIKQMKESKEILKNKEIERKLTNVNKYIKFLEKQIKKGNQIKKYINEIEQSKERKEYYLNTFQYYNSNIEYCLKEIEKIEINKDRFESTLTLYENQSIIEQYINFEYSFKEKEIIDYSLLKKIENLK